MRHLVLSPVRPRSGDVSCLTDVTARRAEGWGQRGEQKEFEKRERMCKDKPAEKVDLGSPNGCAGNGTEKWDKYSARGKEGSSNLRPAAPRSSPSPFPLGLPERGRQSHTWHKHQTPTTSVCHAQMATQMLSVASVTAGTLNAAWKENRDLLQRCWKFKLRASYL